MWPNVIILFKESLRSQDDDLIQYTLSLLTNLTKSVQHRHTMCEHDMVKEVVRLLGSMRFNLTKHAVLAELASVIGQLCNDDDMEKEMCQKNNNTIARLLDIFNNAAP